MEIKEKDDLKEKPSSEESHEDVFKNESDESGKSEAKQPRGLIYVAGGLVAVILVAVFGWWLYSRQFATTDNAFIEGNITIISPKLSARVTKIHITENKQVKQGDLLLELESREAENKLAQAQANLQAAIANKNKAEANARLTNSTGRADITQAESNLEASKNNIEQNRLAATSKESNVELMRRQTITAEANLRQAQTQIKAFNAEIERSKARAKASASSFEIARIELERDRQLFTDGVVSKRQLDQSGREFSEAEANSISAQKEVEIMQTRRDTAERQIEVETARLNEAKNRVVSAEGDFRQSLQQIDTAASQANESAGRLQKSNSLPTQLAVGNSEIEIADAQIKQAQAAVEQAEIELGYTKIYATQDGFISRKNVQEGQIVQPEQSLMTITQGEIWITANFKETQIEKMNPGQIVDVYVDAYPGVTFRGQVESFQAATGSRFSVLPSDNAGGNFVKVVQKIPVKIIFTETPDKKYLLVPGMSVVPKVHIR